MTDSPPALAVHHDVRPLTDTRVPESITSRMADDPETDADVLQVPEPPTVRPTGAASTHPTRVRALECRVENGSIAIPVEAVGQIVEYEVCPLPLARGAVRGLGLIDGQLVISLALGTARPVERRRAKGVLLRVEDQGGVWALEVNEVLSFVEVDVPSVRTRGAKVKTPDARELTWLDAERLVAEVDLLLAEDGDAT